MSRFLVVGAGLAGATLARLLTDDGQDVTIIDRRNKIAGNCRTENQNGIDIHIYGAHIFHTSNENVWRFVNRFADLGGKRITMGSDAHDKDYLGKSFDEVERLIPKCLIKGYFKEKKFYPLDKGDEDNLRKNTDDISEVGL